MNFSQYVRGDALVLSKTKINISELVGFLQNNVRITQLSLRHCDISGKGAETLANGNLSHLASLDLGWNSIGDQGAETLANGNLLNLTSLNLDNNNIGDQGAETLANGNLLNLTSLNLDNNNIGDQGAETLANGNLSHLTSLNLWGNSIGKRGAETLANGNLLNLTSLSLSRQSSDVFLAKLKERREAETTRLREMEERYQTEVTRDEQGRTPLHWAASREVVNALIDRGADINAKDRQERTPLHRAAAKGYTEIVNALIDRGADINAKDRQERTPLHWAVEFGHKGATEILIQKILTQDFSVQKPNYLKDASSTYWDKCKNKIEGKIGNSNTSYLDLLKAGENKVVKYVTNHEIRNILNDLDYEEFPIFGSEIKNKFCEGMKRRELIDDGKRVIERFDCGSNIKLNSYASEKIAFYLPNSGLKKLKGIGDNNKNAHVEPSTKMDETREEQGITGNERKI